MADARAAFVLGFASTFPVIKVNAMAALKRTLWALCLLFALFIVVPPAGSRSRHADLLLFNARVITMDPKHPAAEAIAIQQDRIAWVGSNAEARKIFGANVRSVDLHGATVLPGIIDAHTHMLELGKSLLRLNLKDVATPEEAVARVRQGVASAAPGEWILGWGWDEGKWAAHYPDNNALSQASPENPVFLVGLHSFAAWANKKALALSGITAATQD